MLRFAFPKLRRDSLSDTDYIRTFFKSILARAAGAMKILLSPNIIMLAWLQSYLKLVKPKKSKFTDIFYMPKKNH